MSIDVQRKTIQIEPDTVQTLVWIEDELFDFAQGRSYSLDSNGPNHLGYRLCFNFDAAIVSDDGIYAVVYQKLGTKGLLLKHGQILREINRSYYQSDMYEYPVAFFKAPNGKAYLIHCPIAYNQIDIEDIETGELITNIKERNPSDFFHSRLEVSPDNKYFLTKGWVWHPCDRVAYFDIEACLKNPLLLDQPIEPVPILYEVATASFIDNNLVLLGINHDADYFDNIETITGLSKSQLIIWDVNKNRIIQQLDVNFKIGNFIIINHTIVLDLYHHPKLVNFRTCELIQEFAEINSGLQCSSIIGHLENLPKVVWSKENKQLALVTESTIEILSFK